MSVVPFEGYNTALFSIPVNLKVIVGFECSIEVVSIVTANIFDSSHPQ